MVHPLPSLDLKSRLFYDLKLPSFYLMYRPPIVCTMDIYGLCLSHQDMDREYRYQLTLCLHQEPQYAVEQFPLLQEPHFGKEITQSEAKASANSPNSNSKFDKFIFLKKSNGSMSLRAEQCQLHPPCRYGSILFKL